MSKAPVPKRPSAQSTAYAGRLSANMGLSTIPDNMKSEELTTMNFKVASDFHARFKITAVQHGITMRDLLEESFELWLKEKTKEGAR